MGSVATGAEPSGNAPPVAIGFVKILLKNGNRIEESCNTEVYGETLKDKLLDLISPEGTATQVVITYKCVDDKRETRDTRQVVPVWLCSMTGRGIWKNAAKELKKEGFDIENMDIVDGEMEVYSTSIDAYLDKKDLSIVDLSCL